MNEVIVSMKDITKSFPGVKALDLSLIHICRKVPAHYAQLPYFSIRTLRTDPAGMCDRESDRLSYVRLVFYCTCQCDDGSFPDTPACDRCAVPEAVPLQGRTVDGMLYSVFGASASDLLYLQWRRLVCSGRDIGAVWTYACGTAVSPSGAFAACILGKTKDIPVSVYRDRAAAVAFADLLYLYRRRLV